MSAPNWAGLPEQQRAFELALAERLDVDPETAVLSGWRVDGDQGVVTLNFYLPGDELVTIFNTGRTDHRSLRTRIRSCIEALCDCGQTGCQESETRAVLVGLLDAEGAEG